MPSLRQRIHNRIKHVSSSTPFACFRSSTHVGVTCNDYHVPDHILIEILGRVRGEDLIQCKSVCRRWRKLISSRLFIKFQVSRAEETHRQSLFIQCVYQRTHSGRNLHYSISDTQRTFLSPFINTNLVYRYRFCPDSVNPLLPNSCRGLLVIDKSMISRSLVIFNPLTKAHREILNTPTRSNSTPYVCGFYFDRFTNEYKLLYILKYTVDISAEFYIYNLALNTWQRLCSTNSTECEPRRGCQASTVGDVMYWQGDDPFNHCSKMVVAFDIKSEKVYCLPHPQVNPGFSCATTDHNVFINHLDMMQLITKDGQLCFCHNTKTVAGGTIVNLWILEDNANWESWVMKYKVDHLRFLGEEPYPGPVHIVCSMKGTNEIIYTWKSDKVYDGGLWLYHLETHKMSRFSASDEIRIGANYVAIPYSNTMLSPYFTN